jgi:hypothetical protein
MRWKQLTNSSVFVVGAVVAIWLTGGLSGCAYVINPFADQSVPPEEMTTASERTARESRATPTVRHREWPASTATYPSGAVVHWPLWWEDPFEDKGSDDGKFAWTAEDYFAMGYSFGRFLLNTVGWPVSAVVTPPGTPMVSDGRLSRQALGMDHDAIPLRQAEREASAGSSDQAQEQDEGQLAGQQQPPDAAEPGPPAPTQEGPIYVEPASHQP